MFDKRFTIRSGLGGIHDTCSLVLKLANWFLTASPSDGANRTLFCWQQIGLGPMTTCRECRCMESAMRNAFIGYAMPFFTFGARQCVDNRRECTEQLLEGKQDGWQGCCTRFLILCTHRPSCTLTSRPRQPHSIIKTQKNGFKNNNYNFDYSERSSAVGPDQDNNASSACH